MARFYMSGGENELTWTIDEMSVPFNTSNYKRAGITKYRFTVGDVSSISGIEDYVNAPSYGSSTWVSGTLTGLAAGTYTFWGWAQAANGKYYPAGSDTVTVTSYVAESPSVSWFSVSPVDGTLSVDCYWTISNSCSGISYELRASETYPYSPQSDGWTKGTFYYTNGQAHFDKSGTFYIWLNVFVDGSYVASSTIKSVTTSLQKPGTWSWSWYASNAFSSKGAITNLTQTEWNNFIDHVNLAISYYNAAKNDSISMVYSTSKMGYDKIMYATSFSQVCSALNTLCWRLYVQDAGPMDVAKGKTIYGHYFTDLSGALNRAINAM